MMNTGRMQRLPREFFGRPSTRVAPELLGCVLWHDSPAGLVAVRLAEVEAYQGSADPASHAFRGQTARNTVMFGAPGYAYVYFTYGMHFCVNLVCQPPGRAEAVLIRAGQVITGAGLARTRRLGLSDQAWSDGPGDADQATDQAAAQAAGRAAAGGRRIRELDLARGPGRLCQALGIGPAETVVGRDQIRTGPRVGISQATDRPWRYWLAGDGHVSVYRPSKPRAARPKPVSGGSTEDGTIHR